jgi:hypothetical protein
MRCWRAMAQHTRTTVGAGTGRPRGLHHTDDGAGRVAIGVGVHAAWASPDTERTRCMLHARRTTDVAGRSPVAVRRRPPSAQRFGGGRDEKHHADDPLRALRTMMPSSSTIVRAVGARRVSASGSARRTVQTTPRIAAGMNHPTVVRTNPSAGGAACDYRCSMPWQIPSRHPCGERFQRGDNNA